MNSEHRKNIIPINISKEMKESFIAYSMSVITSRALPDVRDGLKPVHRRILFAMNDIGLTASARFKKSATIIGDVLGKYHPHGDSSVYEAMVNLAQDFSTRYPLVWGQGNFGSIDGDGAAAYRYTEAKMAKLTGEMLRDIEKDTVDFVSNYDDTRKEPTVLPTAIPSLLLNGGLGIAVGMATNIPPHNLSEVIDATITLIDNPRATVEDLLVHVKGPDFPLGGIAYNVNDIKEAYSTGRGKVTVRGEVEVVETSSGKSQIIISSIPYRVNKANLIIKIADLVRNKKIKGIKSIRDESTSDIRVVIDIKSGGQPKRILNNLYKNTDLQQNFNYNMVALVDGIPYTLGLKDIIEHFIKHRQEVVRRRLEFDLRKAEARAHILEGLNKALDHIDEVIALIKKSKDTGDARVKLMKKFTFSEIQANAILDMKLQKLAGLERKKIEDELREILKYIKELKALLKSQEKMLALIKEELVDIKAKYGDERRTKIVSGAINSIREEDLIPQKEYALVLTENGYLKRTDPEEYKTQKRGGIGVIDLDTKDEDIVSHFILSNSHSDILFFSDQGKVYQTKMYELPEGKRSTKGKSIKNFLPLEGEEKITSILSVPKGKELESYSLFFMTKKGVSKRVRADAFKAVRSNGLIALSLKDGDELLSVSLVEEKDEVIAVSSQGKSIRFLASDVRSMGRAATGIKGMTLAQDDFVVGLGVIKSQINEKELELLVLSENGYGKKTVLHEYKIQKRGGSGIKTFNLNKKTGLIIGAKIVHESVQELIAISQRSQVIRTELKSIPSLGRATQGVKVMKLKEGDSVASLILI
ncbi:MAG: DNA gyrase subunit A [Candidatus Pacebacteria bacterium]|nr:DNA gyrase subunit A [Candidatus Paceibacterota bacterium]